MTTGEKIAALRRDHKLSQEALGEKLARFGLGFGVADKFHNPSASVSKNSNFSNLALYTEHLPE